MARFPLYLQALERIGRMSPRSPRSGSGTLTNVDRRQGTQGPLLPRVTRGPRCRVRRRASARPDRARVGADPRLPGSHRRRRQPRLGPRQLQGFRRTWVLHRRAVRRRPPEGRAGRVDGLRIRHIDQLEEDASRLGVAIGIIATPGGAAQEVAERLERAGVRSILNFAPATIRVAPAVVVRSVDLSTELQILSYYLSRA